MRHTKLKHNSIILLLILLLFLLWYFYNKEEKKEVFRHQTESLDLFKFQENFSYTFQKIILKETNLLKQLGNNLFGFNIIRSQELPASRSLPDTRPPRCQDLKYNPDDMHPVSIIIPVFNELHSVLVRTVATLMAKTPDDLIREIIIVDDFSTYHDTRLAYDTIGKSFTKVVIHHQGSRQGLIKAKIAGALLAKSKILVFLDSHTEVNVGWLPPLLSEIATDPMHKVAVPTIDTIDPETFEYERSPDVKGGFNWGLYFTWIENSNANVNDVASTNAILTPTLSGGYFAMTKKMYDHFGGYDSKMKTWGGENLEMSFRIWQCGGKIEILPCSRVGHIFRPTRPNLENDSADDWLRNVLRMAHVWMDTYIEKFYKIRPEARNYKYGDIRNRKLLRKKLKCSSFQWYLENVYPDMLNRA